MSWRDALSANPHPYTQYSHNIHNTPQAGVSEDSGNTGYRVQENNTVPSIAADLREQAQRAGSWPALHDVLKEAQAAFDAGAVTRAEVESLAGHIMDRSRQIPGDEPVAKLLTRQPVVRVRSRLLGEVVVWVADAAAVTGDTGEVVYTESELRRMVGMTPAEVRAIHAAKRSFDGELVE